MSCAPSVLSDFSYVIPADVATAANSAVNTAATCSNSVALAPSGTCVLTETLEIFDAANNEWELYDGSPPSTTDWPFVDAATFDPTLGTRGLQIKTGDRTSYNEPTTFNFRWKITDALSTVSGGTIYQTFDVTLSYICWQDAMVLNTAAATSGQLQVIDG